MIRTVTGDITAEELGFTYSHEHLVGSAPAWKTATDPDLEILDEDKAVEEAMVARRAGVRSLFEASAWDYGRDPAALRRISERTGVQIIACAGFNKGEWFEDLVGDWTVDQLTEQIVTDVTTGMDGTDVRGGVIKFGTGYNHISEAEQRVIRAAARAHRATGAPLHGHTEVGTMALEQLELLRSEGVDLRRVALVHLTRNPDPFLHRQIAATGAYLCFDGFSKIKYFPESTRIAGLTALIEAGYEDHVLIGGDLARRSDLAAYTGGPGLGYIAEKWLPRLRAELLDSGYSSQRVADVVHRLFVANPADYFDIVTPY